MGGRSTALSGAIAIRREDHRAFVVGIRSTRYVAARAAGSAGLVLHASAACRIAGGITTNAILIGAEPACALPGTRARVAIRLLDDAFRCARIAIMRILAFCIVLAGRETYVVHSVALIRCARSLCRRDARSLAIA